MHGPNGNASGKAVVVFNYDCIFYGQFSPSTVTQPAPAPQVCALYTGVSTNEESTIGPPQGIFAANDTDPTLPPGQIKLSVQPRITAGNYATAYFNTPLVSGQTYTLFYTIPLYSFSGQGSGGQIKIRAQNIESNLNQIFTLSKAAQNGYITFVCNTNSPNFGLTLTIESQLQGVTTAQLDPGTGGFMYFGLANSLCAS